MSVVALKIVEEYRQIPVAKVIDVALVVCGAAVFAGSVAVVLDLVVGLCELLFLQRAIFSQLKYILLITVLQTLTG